MSKKNVLEKVNNNYVGYCKENNLTQLPVFCFSKRKKHKMKHEWLENGIKFKLSCSCEYGVPSSFEYDVYSACLRIWVRQGMSDRGIFTCASEIAKILDLDIRSWSCKIKDAIEKLCYARYEVENGFVRKEAGGERKMLEKVWFSLFQSASLFQDEFLDKKITTIALTFHNEIKSSLDAKYYQWLDFALYQEIKPGLARRLYEFLEKKRYNNADNSFSIAEEKLCHWLPIEDKNVTTRRKTLKQHCEELIRIGYLKKYIFKKSVKICIFFYKRRIPIPVELDNNQVSVGLSEEKNGELERLFSEAKKVTSWIKQRIEFYYAQNGFDYVLWNIRYSNAHAKKSYHTYLDKSLKENWAASWKEEQLQKDIEKKVLDKEQAKEHQKEIKKKQSLESEQILFEEKHNALSAEKKRLIWQDADNSVEIKKLGRGMLVRIQYIKLLLDEFRREGFEFSDEVVSNLGFVKQITSEFKSKR